METFRRPASNYYSRPPQGSSSHYQPLDDDVPEEPPPPPAHSSNPFMIGAKTVAGIGLGLVTVVAGSAIIGLAAETVIVPSILLKLAGGIAGGGIGMARGLQDKNTKND